MSVNTPTYFQSYMGYVYFDGSIVGCAQSYNLDTTRDIEVIQCIGSDSKRKVAGPYEWSVSFDALQILTEDASVGRKTLDDIMNYYLDSGTDTVEVMLKPKLADTSTGQAYYSGDGLVESVGISYSSGAAPATYSISIQGSGDLTVEAL